MSDEIKETGLEKAAEEAEAPVEDETANNDADVVDAETLDEDEDETAE